MNIALNSSDLLAVNALGQFREHPRVGARRTFINIEGHTQTRRAADLPGIPEFIAEGAQLGDLWMEGHFGVGDPLTEHGGPISGPG